MDGARPQTLQLLLKDAVQASVALTDGEIPAIPPIPPIPSGLGEASAPLKDPLEKIPLGDPPLVKYYLDNFPRGASRASERDLPGDFPKGDYVEGDYAEAVPATATGGRDFSAAAAAAPLLRDGSFGAAAAVPVAGRVGNLSAAVAAPPLWDVPAGAGEGVFEGPEGRGAGAGGGVVGGPAAVRRRGPGRGGGRGRGRSGGEFESSDIIGTGFWFQGRTRRAGLEIEASTCTGD